MPYASSPIGEIIYGDAKVFTTRPTAGIVVEVDGLDITKIIEPDSLVIENVLTREVDTCNFTIRSYGGNLYSPQNEATIIIYQNNEKIFAGSIVGVSQRMKAAKLVVYDIRCVDYTHSLDRKLVATSYSDKTIDYIIADIMSNYLSGFTGNNVNCSKTINYIAFNYEPASKCFQRLAELVGYDWYVDYDKDIHFFSKETTLSPFNLTDTSGNYIFRSLVVKNDTSQVKNIIYVRGGEYLGSSFTEYQFGDGTKVEFKLAYKYSGIAVTVGGAAQTVGIDFISDPADYDCLYNFDDKVIKFRSDNKPGDTIAVNISGLPYVPVIVETRDQNSKDQYGQFQFRIIDKSIKTKDSARERGKGELESYSAKIVESSFITHKQGLRSGQLINVQSDIRSLDEDYLINRVSARMRTEDDMIYQVSLISTKIMNAIEFFQKLLMADDRKITIGENEVVDRLWTGRDDFPIFTEQAPSYSVQAPPWYVKGSPQTDPLAIVGFCQAS